MLEPALEPGGMLLSELFGELSADPVGYADQRQAWYGAAVGPLVVRDDDLAELGRRWLSRSVRPGSEPGIDPGDLPVSVVNSSGAGGLVALARRSVPGVEVVAAETALRDLDDLAQNAARVVAAAAELPGLTVFVEVPFAHGWQAAVEEVEAGDLRAKVTVQVTDQDTVQVTDQDTVQVRLAERLSGLVEADLGFKLSLPTGGGELRFRTLLTMIEALIEGAEPPGAVELLRSGQDELRGWDRARQQRVRRRLLGYDSPSAIGPVGELVESGLLVPPQVSGS